MKAAAPPAPVVAVSVPPRTPGPDARAAVTVTPGTAAACANVTAMCGAVPWAVLSAGVDHATFLGQVETAMANGASGVIAGRSLWKDCIHLDAAEMERRLTERAVPRLRELQAVIAKYRG